MGRAAGGCCQRVTPRNATPRHGRADADANTAEAFRHCSVPVGMQRFHARIRAVCSTSCAASRITFFFSMLPHLTMAIDVFSVVYSHLCILTIFSSFSHCFLTNAPGANAPGVPWCRVSSLEMLNSLLDDMPSDADNLGVVDEKGEY